MRTLTALVLAVVFTLAVIAPSLLVYLVEPPRPKRMGPSIEDYVVEKDDNTYLVRKPPSWREMLYLAQSGEASYEYITWYSVSDLWTLYNLYVSHNKSCKELIEMHEHEMTWYAFLFRDNCRWLKTFLFNNTRDWYLAHGFIGPLVDRWLEEHGGEVDLYVLVYRVDEGLMIEFYDIHDKTRLTELKEKIHGFVSREPVLVLLDRLAVSTWWYSLYTYLTENNIPYVILLPLYSSGSPSPTPYEEVLETILGGALAKQIRGGEAPSVRAVVYVDGEPVAVVVEQVSDCVLFTNNTVCGREVFEVLGKVLGAEELRGY